MINPYVIHVAIVDANPMLADALATGLSKDFNVLITASHGRELLNKIEQASHQPDICIVDIVMSEMNGYETTKRIKEKYPFINVLAIAEVYAEQSVLQILKCGASGYLLKNSSIELVKNALIEVCNSGTFFSAEILEKVPKLKEGDIKGCLKRALSESDIEFLSLCCTDMSYEKIAKKMFLTKRAIEHKIEKIKAFTGIHTRQGLAMYAMYTGFGTSHGVTMST